MAAPMGVSVQTKGAHMMATNKLDLDKLTREEKIKIAIDLIMKAEPWQIEMALAAALAVDNKN